MEYYDKYLKYKSKYLDFKNNNLLGGVGVSTNNKFVYSRYSQFNDLMRNLRDDPNLEELVIAGYMDITQMTQFFALLQNKKDQITSLTINYNFESNYDEFCQSLINYLPIFLTDNTILKSLIIIERYLRFYNIGEFTRVIANSLRGNEILEKLRIFLIL